jgi:hypothetical protein
MRAGLAMTLERRFCGMAVNKFREDPIVPGNCGKQ